MTCFHLYVRIAYIVEDLKVLKLSTLLNPSKKSRLDWDPGVKLYENYNALNCKGSASGIGTFCFTNLLESYCVINGASRTKNDIGSS